MRYIILLAALLILISVTAACAEVKPPPWFKPLFNGRDLTGWKHDAEVEKNWRVIDGIIVYDGLGKNLATEKNYRNFILTLRWKIEKDGNSGVYLRGMPQVQICDRTEGSGGLYDDGISPVRNVDRPVGQWNHFVIILRGDKVTVVENGIQVVDRKPMKNLPPEGEIELQHHKTPLWFKDIYIRELP